MKRKLLKSLFFLMIVLTTKVSAQERTVTGVVTAKEDGTALPGVSVKVKETTLSTSTYETGAFTIRVAAWQSLVISYIGYLTQDVPVGPKTPLKIALVNDAQNFQKVTNELFFKGKEGKPMHFANRVKEFPLGLMPLSSKPSRIEGDS